MSKKKIYNKHLEKGRFYIHSDGHGGHPALLYKKSDKKNIYFIVVFTSSSGPKRKQLKHSIEPIKIKVSFVHNTPKISSRRELGRNPMKGLKIDKEDKPLIETIKRKKWFTRPLNDLHMRITTYIKPKGRKWCNIETCKCPICGKYYKNVKIKSPVNGAAQFPVSRHQTSDGHDHSHI